MQIIQAASYNNINIRQSPGYCEVFHGFVPQELTTFLQHNHINSQQAHILAAKILIWITNYTRRYIWLPRCQIQIRIDKQNNLTSKQKKSRLPRKGRPPDSTTITPYKTIARIHSDPNLCECEQPQNNHINNQCPPSYTSIKTGNTVANRIVKLQAYSDNIIDILAPV